MEVKWLGHVGVCPSRQHLLFGSKHGVRAQHKDFDGAGTAGSEGAQDLSAGKAR
jgi:hypothetical protein